MAHLAPLFSLRARLAIFALLCAVPVLTLSALQLRGDSARIRTAAVDATNNLAEVAARRLEQDLVNAEVVSQAVGSVVHPDTLGSCSLTLARVVAAAGPRVTNFIAVSPAGDVLCSGRPLTWRVNVGDRPHVISALASQRPVVSDFAVGRVSGQDNLQLVVPIQLGAGGSTDALVVAGLTAATLLDGIPLDDSLHLTLMMLDRRGTLVSRSTDVVMPRGQQLADSDIFRRREQVAGKPTVLAGPDGVRRLYVTQPVRFRGETVAWIASGAQVEALEQLAFEARRRNLAIVGLLAAAVMGLAVLVFRPVVLGRYRGLLRVATHVEGGAYGARVAVRVVDDITPLELAVNQMLDAIERDRAGLESRVRERTLELEQSNRDLQAFTYSVSHDLRAPVATITAFSQQLEERQVLADAKDRHFLARILAAARRMDALIEGMLALAQINRAEIVPEPLDVSAMAREAAQECREAEPGREVKVRVADGMSARGDRRLMQAALANLLSNAWKFTRHTQRAEIAVIPVLAEGGHIAICVRDNGAGFDEKYASRLFEAFHRLHGNKDYPGLGIGLATVQRIVDRHHGRVWAEGAVGHGAAFYFYFAD
ncbi:sensor histidine kinase [Caenimonas aquaedulcis]|nr:sensor histidine kinase [Caenimonas aquaedulcis]